MLLSNISINYKQLTEKERLVISKFINLPILEHTYFEKPQKWVHSLWQLRLEIKEANNGNFPIGVEEFMHRISIFDFGTIKTHTIEFESEDIAIFTDKDNNYIGLVY